MLLSPMDFALIKIDRLEKEDARKELRLSALRCRLTELLENPIVVIVKDNDDKLLVTKDGDDSTLQPLTEELAQSLDQALRNSSQLVAKGRRQNAKC